MCLNSPSHGLALKKRFFYKTDAKLLLFFGISKFSGQKFEKKRFYH